MFEKQKITQINRYTTGKDGQPLTFKGKDGNQVPYTRLLVKTDRQGDKLMSGFGNKDNANWKVGDEIEIKVEQVMGKDGKTYYNFETPKKDDLLLARINKLEGDVILIKNHIRELADRVSGADKLTSAGTKVPDFSEVDITYPEDEVDISKIPF